MFFKFNIQSKQCPSPMWCKSSDSMFYFSTKSWTQLTCFRQNHLTVDCNWGEGCWLRRTREGMRLRRGKKLLRREKRTWPFLISKMHYWQNHLYKLYPFVLFALLFCCYLCCHPLKSQIISNRFTSNKIFYPLYIY